MRLKINVAAVVAIAGSMTGIAAAQQQTNSSPATPPPPTKERVSVPWYQSGAHRATVVRAGEAAPKQGVYTNVNGKVVSTGSQTNKEGDGVARFGSRTASAGTSSKDTRSKPGNTVKTETTVVRDGDHVDVDTNKTLPDGLTISRETDWEGDGDTVTRESETTGPDGKTISRESTMTREGSTATQDGTTTRPSGVSLVSHDQWVRTKSNDATVVNHEGSTVRSSDNATATRSSTTVRNDSGAQHFRATRVNPGRTEPDKSPAKKRN